MGRGTGTQTIGAKYFGNKVEKTGGGSQVGTSG